MTSQYDHCDAVADPENEIATVASMSLIVKMQSHIGLNVFSFFILDETVSSYQTCLIFKPFSPFIEIFNRKIQHIFESGIVLMWSMKYVAPLRKQMVETGPQVLTMDHLGVGFVFCCFPLLFSFIVFCLELLVAAIKRRRN